LTFVPAPKSIDVGDIAAEIEPTISLLAEDEAEAIRANVVTARKTACDSGSIMSREEQKALAELRKNSAIVITKSDKGRATVIMDRADYHQKCVDLLNDKATYKEIKQDPTKSLEKKVNNYVLQLKKKEAITQSTWRY